jgi:protein-disulfide isomerase
LLNINCWRTIAPPVKRSLPFIVVGLVAAVTLITATVFFRAQKRSQQIALAAGILPPAARGHSFGPEDASVTLEEFGDFQCPPCAKVSGALDELEKEFRPNLKIVFRNFPLPVHMHAQQAALAAEAAGLQGKFWEMHHLLYGQQAEWSVAPEVETLFNTYATLAGLDLARFKSNMQSEEIRERIESDRKRGSSVGVEQTPTIFVNGQLVPPAALNPVGLRNAVEAVIRNASAR